MTRPANIVDGPRPRRQNRTTILNVMNQLLRHRSLDTISMEEIAAAAGLSRRTIYNHFASTSEIFRLSRTNLVAELRAALPEGPRGDLPPHLALARFAARAAGFFAASQHRDLHLSMVRDSCDWLAQAYAEQVLNPMTTCLSAYLATHWPHACFDPAEAAESFLDVLRAMCCTKAAPGTNQLPFLVDALLMRMEQRHALAA